MRIGIDLGGTKIEGIILDQSGVVLEKIRIATPGQEYQQILNAVTSVVTELQSRAASRLSVGIGTPGSLSLVSNTMKNCNSISLNGQPLKADIETQLGYEIRLENDANCFALSEAHHGAGSCAHSVFGAILGTGTGGGIVINQQLLTGPNSIAGEWGHNPVPGSVLQLIGDERKCYCGRFNCIETVLSGSGMSQTHKERSKQSLTAMEIAKAAASDASARETLEIYSAHLAQCLSTVVNLLDPDVIVLGGGLSNIPLLYETVPAQMSDYVFTDAMTTRLSPPSFGDASGARGAACLWPIGEGSDLERMS